MGCDWYIYVQALFKDEDGSKRWVTLNRDGEYTKTGCGGNPLRYTFRKYIEAGHANGSFGGEFQNVSDADTSDNVEHSCVECHEEDLEVLNQTYGTDGEVLAKKQKTGNEPASKKDDCLDPEEVLEKRGELSRKIEATKKKLKERGYIGSHPEWECFHMSISEYQGLCDALLEGEYAYNYCDHLARMLEWTDVLENFTRDPPSHERVSKESMGYKQYLCEKAGEVLGPPNLEQVREEVKRWKDAVGDYKAALQMLPGLCKKIGCNEVGRTILGFCGRSSPLDLRFSVQCEEGHLEEYRKGNMKGAHAFDGSCSIM